MWTYLLGPLLALLPKGWRVRWFADAPVNWPRAGTLSGFLQGFGCLLGLIAWYLFFIQGAVDQQTGATAQAIMAKGPPKGATDVGLSYAIGFSALSAFLLQPLTWVLGFLAVEGVLRMFAAWLTEETPGTLPLVLFDRGAAAMQRLAFKVRVPLVADVATPGSKKDPWDLKVESCRRKPLWTPGRAIRFEDALYRVEASYESRPPRPFGYRLVLLPPSEVARGVLTYSPEEPLRGQ